MDQAVISHDVLAAYAADAARETDGVIELVEVPRRHRGVRVAEDGGEFTIEVHVAVSWGARIPEVGADVQTRVAEYVRRTASIAVSVDVVVAGVAAAPIR